MSITADLSGKTAIVTGASSGIGRGIPERMGAAGAHVILSGRTADAMEQSAGLIAAAGGRATVVVGDIRPPSRSTVDVLVAAALESDGHLDIFVNNAGVLSGWRPRRQRRTMERDARHQRPLAARRRHGSRRGDAQCRQSRPHRQRLVGRRAPSRFGRLRRHQARGQRDHDSPRVPAPRRSDSSGLDHAGPGGHQHRTQRRPRAARRHRGDVGHRGRDRPRRTSPRRRARSRGRPRSSPTS